jgi:hypothetical protein
MVALPVHTQEDAPSPERIYTKETNYSGYCDESREGGIGNNEINELTPEGMGADWRHLFEERAAHREYDGGYTHAEAERLAWGEMQNRWHMEHGDRVPRDLCPGCRQQLGSTEVLDLIDGTRVHFKNNECLIRYGERWRTAATRGLLGFGLKPPSSGR